MDERIINRQTLRTMTCEELHRLNNALYYTESIEGQWLVQSEIVRRKQEQNAERPADPGDDS